MVGARKLMKLLHCNRLRKNYTIPKKSSPEQQSFIESGSLLVNIKIENDESDKKCRVCLKIGEIPIYDNNLTENLSDALKTFGGIDISIDDTYPKLLCQSCYAFLQGAILFRKTAQETEDLLRKQLPLKIPTTTNDDRHIGAQSDDWADSESDHDFDFPEVPKPSQEKIGKYYCPRCDLEFDTEDQCRDHILSEEHANKRVTCPICNKSYNASYYKKHKFIHNNEGQYMCDVCGKKFMFQGCFSRHRQTHFYKLPFKCSLCPYKGRFTESLKMHMRTHTGEKPYQCTECSSRFISKSNLNKHMHTHKSQRDFKCQTCGRGFNTKRNLDMHFKVEHTGMKDHVCNICGKAFGYRKQMMKHQLKVHKREKLRCGRLPLYLQVESMIMKGVPIAEP